MVSEPFAMISIFALASVEPDNVSVELLVTLSSSSVPRSDPEDKSGELDDDAIYYIARSYFVLNECPVPLPKI